MIPAEGLYLESVILERPLGDFTLDRDLWTAESAQLPAATKALLAENGLRVVIMGGNLPPAFQKILTSESDMVNPHALTFANRKDAVLPTAGPIDPCAYQLLPDLAGERAAVQLRRARCGLDVRPEATEDGQVKLWCEPRVQHGDRQDFLRPSEDGTQFTVQGEVPQERYPNLGFEVTLGPNDYLIVGSPATATDTLGSVMFTAEVGSRPRQRVLAIRVSKRGEVPVDWSNTTPRRSRPAIAAEAARW